MTDKDLMQQALDALEAGLTINDRDSLRWTKTIEALRARLAQPESEPVCWMYDFPNPDNPAELISDWTADSMEEVVRNSGVNVRPLYTAPPQREWKGLTDEEIKSLLWETRVDNLTFARVIEKVLREKNAA